jgi:hypothetical protein
MDRKELKQEMLKMLKSDMVGMKKKGKKDLFEGKMPKKMDKVTVMSDSKEGLMEGLSKAEQIMKAKLGDKSESKDESKEESKGKPKCDMCDMDPCECEECEE